MARASTIASLLSVAAVLLAAHAMCPHTSSGSFVKEQYFQGGLATYSWTVSPCDLWSDQCTDNLLFISQRVENNSCAWSEAMLYCSTVPISRHQTKDVWHASYNCTPAVNVGNRYANVTVNCDEALHKIEPNMTNVMVTQSQAGNLYYNFVMRGPCGSK